LNAVCRVGESHQIVIRLCVGNYDPVRVVQETPEGNRLSPKRGQIEEANRRSIVCFEKSYQVGGGVGATNLAQFQGNTVDMLAPADSRSSLGGKCGRD
jgi:hypothetical protein